MPASFTRCVAYRAETQTSESLCADIDEAIGRGHGDMRTPRNLQSLSEERLAVRLREGTWPQGIAWLKQDRELSDR